MLGSRLLTLVLTALLAVVLAERIVTEYRQEIETWANPLQKRACSGYVAASSNGGLPSSFSCSATERCCSGITFETCIPSEAICCDFTTAVSWCPSDLVCDNPRFGTPGCVARQTEAPTFNTSPLSSPTLPTTSTTSTLSAASGSGSDSLPKGSIIGIAVSVICSVLGLLFGIGFKIWSHRRKGKREAQKLAQAHAQAEVQAQAQK